MKRKKYKVVGMHCTSCAMSIEWELEDNGVKAKCDFARAILEVEFDPVKVNEEKIVAAVLRTGYKLEEISN